MLLRYHKETTCHFTICIPIFTICIPIFTNCIPIVSNNFVEKLFTLCSFFLLALIVGQYKFLRSDIFEFAFRSYQITSSKSFLLFLFSCWLWLWGRMNIGLINSFFKKLFVLSSFRHFRICIPIVSNNFVEKLFTLSFSCWQQSKFDFVRLDSVSGNCENRNGT